MNYRIDLDPAHAVIRLTIMEEMVGWGLAEDCYRRLSEITSAGGPYSAIYDLSATKRTTIPTERVRTFARRRHPLQVSERKHVIVGEAPVIFGLARLFQMCGEAVSKEHEVVHTLEEAYEIVGARPEDFTERIFPTAIAA